MTKTTGTILLVDDEAKIRQALAQALREDGHEVVAVGNPREAQRLLTRGSFDVLLVVVNRAIDHQRLRTQHGYLLSERDEEFNQYGIVGRSKRIQEVIRTAEMVAKSKSTVIITGETGTGEEVVARAFRFHTVQRERSLVKVNCAADPKNLLEFELFGHM